MHTRCITRSWGAKLYTGRTITHTHTSGFQGRANITFVLFFLFSLCRGLFVAGAWCQEDKANNARGNTSSAEQFTRVFFFSKMRMRYFDKGQCKLFGPFSINTHPYSSVNRWQLCLAHKAASLKQRPLKLFRGLSEVTSATGNQQVTGNQYSMARTRCQDSGSDPKRCYMIWIPCSL